MELMKCPQCGSQFPDNTRKCPVCDYILDGSGYYEPESDISQYEPPYGSVYEERPEQTGGTGLAIASMVLGIVSIVLTCLFIGILPGIVGLILGIISIAKDKPGKGMAVAGIVTSAIGIVLFFLVFAVILAIPS